MIHPLIEKISLYLYQEDLILFNQQRMHFWSNLQE